MYCRICSLEEKGVKERREQQVAERNEGRADERVISTEANVVIMQHLLLVHHLQSTHIDF